MKKIAAIILAAVMIFTVSSCYKVLETVADMPNQMLKMELSDSEDVNTDKTDWAIYWYLCGSDLETDAGLATEELFEMVLSELPENVRVVIETGGAEQWHNDIIDPDKLQRYVYDSEGLHLVEELPSANMGEAETLSDFLSFASERFPAEKTAVVFWDHGGGSVAGASFDELYEDDSLTLDEFEAAFSTVWVPSEEEPPVELICFDMCLMATIDVANTFSGFGRYLVASQEMELDSGWDYTEILDAVSADPQISGLELGKVICDSYYSACELLGTEDTATLSVTDLTKIPALIEAYDAMGDEALIQASEDESFISAFGRIAADTENYGGNNREEGYTNMADLGHLARGSADLLPSAQRVLSVLSDCVQYKVSGKYRSEATGLSCYYTYGPNYGELQTYNEIGAGTSFKYYYTYTQTGELDEDGYAYIESLGIDSMPEVTTLESLGIDGIEPYINDQGGGEIDIGPDAAKILAGIEYELVYVNEDEDIIKLLGYDDDINADWESGIFSDNFQGKWGSIDGQTVYMELAYEGDDYDLYSVPVVLNGEECYLRVAYDFNDSAWEIQGAYSGVDQETGMADREIRKLEEGDIIEPVLYSVSYSGEDDEWTGYTGEPIEVTEDTAFEQAELPDGQYLVAFDMWDIQGNFAYSGYVLYEYSGGELTSSIW